jgi:hypothetical protein
MSIHGRTKTSYAIAAMLLTFSIGNQAMGQQEASTTPSIVFVGTVEASEAVTLPSLAASPNTSVVAVERVVKKPDAIALAPGDKVTVVTEGGAPPQKGVPALFFTDGLIYGESLAVRVLSWEPVSSATASAVAAEDAKVTAQLQEGAYKELQQSIESADIVIVGHVKRIQPPTVAALAPERQMVSEHNPDWQDAIIEVQSALKGAADSPEVVVRFPASMDVMWAGYPKFKEGQEGTFILHQDRVSGSPAATLEGKAVTVYTAISPKNTLSSGDAARIRRLLGR